MFIIILFGVKFRRQAAGGKEYYFFAVSLMQFCKYTNSFCIPGTSCQSFDCRSINCVNASHWTVSLSIQNKPIVQKARIWTLHPGSWMAIKQTNETCLAEL